MNIVFVYSNCFYNLNIKKICSLCQTALSKGIASVYLEAIFP